MKKYIFLMAGLFVISGQSLLAAAGAGGAGSSTFLDGYDPQVNAENVLHYIAPFSTHFIGKKNTTDTLASMGVGWASYGLAMIGEGEVEEIHASTFQQQLEASIATLAAPSGVFEVLMDGCAERRPWRAHAVSDIDTKIARALYEIVYVYESIERYDQVEREIWAALTPLLGISKTPSEVDPKNLAAMDLLVFLTALEKSAWPCSPTVPRLSRPPYDYDVFPCANKEFLARRFNELVTAYKAT